MLPKPKMKQLKKGCENITLQGNHEMTAQLSPELTKKFNALIWLTIAAQI